MGLDEREVYPMRFSLSRVGTGAALFTSLLGAVVGTPVASAHATVFRGCSTRYVYTVRRGDWLSKVSPRHWQQIAAQSGVARTNRIFPGQTLCISKPQDVAPAYIVYVQPLHSSEVPHTSHNKPVPPAPPAKQTPPPANSSGSGPSNTGGGSQVTLNGGSPCAGSSVAWPGAIQQWTIPTGCFGQIFSPNPSRYVSAPSFGWCNWAAEVFNTSGQHGYGALHLPQHSAPRVGAVVWFAPGVQGAGGAGHYAVVAAIGPNGWLLVLEMNFYWRGGGWAKLDYRYVHTSGGGISFGY